MKAAKRSWIWLGLALGWAIGGASARAGDVESFNSRLFDLQYFARPAERLAAPLAGGFDAALNPAALGAARIAGVELMAGIVARRAWPA